MAVEETILLYLLNVLGMKKKKTIQKSSLFLEYKRLPVSVDLSDI